MRGLRAALFATTAIGLVTGPHGGAVAFNDTQAAATLKDAVNQEYHVSTAELDTTTTAGAVITGLSCALTAGKTYVIRGYVGVTVGASTGGADVALVATNSLSATSINYNVTGVTASAVTSATTAAGLGTYEGGASSYVAMFISGAIVVNAAGTINVYGEEAAKYTTTATKFLLNSFLECVRTN